MNRLSIKLLQQSYIQWQQGELTQAEFSCRKILEQFPDSEDALHLLGLIRRQMGDLAEAEQLIRRSVELAPRHVEFQTNLAKLLRSAGRITEARDQYQAALAIDPHFRPAQLGLLRLLNAIGSTQAASAAYKLAQSLLKVKEKDAEAWVGMGQASRSLGKLAEAEQAYRRALELRPGYGVAHHNLGALLAQLHRADEALQELNCAASFGIKGNQLEYNRASALLELNRPEEAEAALMVAIKADPGARDPHRLLANLRFMRKDPDYLRDLKDSITRLPKQTHLWALWGQLLCNAQQPEEALEVLRQGIERCGSAPELLTVLATTSQELSRSDEALVAAREASYQRPDDESVTSVLISSLLCVGEAKEALPLIRRLRLTAPFSQEYIALEATAARLSGDPLYQKLYDYDAFVRMYELEPPLGWAHIDDFHRDLLPALQARHRFSTHPLNQSLRLGTQTATDLLSDKDPAIQAFLQAIRIPLADYRSAIGFDPNHPLLVRNRGNTVLAGCWSVQLRSGGFHVNHIHPEGWISSAYYVETPAEVVDPKMKSGWLKLGEPRFSVPGATPERFIQPRPGRLVLFPSYMWHGTVPILAKTPRLTIAFDVVTKIE